MIDEHGWTQRDPISEDELILLCVKNAFLSTDRKQILAPY